MNWYLETGKEADIVTSTRIRLARNIKDIPFTVKYTREEAKKVRDIMQEIAPKLGYGLKLLNLSDMDNITKMSLIEKHIISSETALNKSEYSAILINEEENICIIVNEEDHLRIQTFGAGLEIESLVNLILEIDEKLEKLLNYAYNEKYGFLTACPTNVGTGLKASVMVHLPGLTATGNIKKVLDIINNFDMNIRGAYGEGSNTQGNMYQISNKKSLGISEKEIVRSVKSITDKIIEQERLARKLLIENSIELEDKIYRNYGIISNCKKISSEECKELLSDIKLGTDLGILQELNDLKVKKIELYTKPANLQKYLGQTLSSFERDIRRAEIIKNILVE